jgi:hypothetical protein
LRGLSLIFSCSKIGKPIVEIYQSLTDTWMWKLGLRPHNSLSGNISLEFSVLCLCSALYKISISSFNTHSFTSTCTKRHSHIYTAKSARLNNFTTDKQLFSTRVNMQIKNVDF